MMISEEQRTQLTKLGEEIRKQLPGLCPDVLPYPQPGLFRGNKILFIFQNPGTPREDKGADRILMDPKSDIELIERAYWSTLTTSYLGKFIRDIGVGWEEISITNVLKAPTKDNRSPTFMEASLNMPWTKKQIEILQPKLIVLVGGVARKMCNFLAENHNVIFINHYAYHMRRGDYNFFVETTKHEIRQYSKY